MIFFKASSFGNDFLVVEREGIPLGTDPGELARRICDPHDGVGADGVVFHGPARAVASGKAGPGGLAARFEIYNRDGGRAELSGNGMAALAAVLLRRRPIGSSLALSTGIGSRRVRLLERRGPRFRFDVEIGRPDFAHRAFFPFLSKGQDSYRAAGTDFFPVSVGNPHAVVLRRTMPGVARLEALGKKLEGHLMFPGRVNVEFVQPRGPSCRVFFYERGVGPTRASSTGSAAVFAVLRRLGMAGDQLQIEPLAPVPGNGGGDAPIVLRWQGGIQVEIVTRLICKGRYFG